MERGNELSAKRIAVVAGSAVALVAVCCGVALATGFGLPFGSDGTTIQGCYSNGGALKLLTPSSPTCPPGYTPIHWSVTGPKGDKGDPGTNGTNGTDGLAGVSPTVTAEGPGANCPAGGAAITGANNATVYVCNGQNGQRGQDGEPFSGTFTSGDYSISVTASGITLQGPGVDKISLTGTGLTMQSSDAISIRGSQDVNVRAANTLGLRGDVALNAAGGSSFNASAGGALNLNGSLVGINKGVSCKLASRAGDQILGSLQGDGTTVLGSILVGEPTVCIGG